MLLPVDKEFPSVKRLTSGGERFDLNLFSNLQKIFTRAKILNVYASTEAGTLFASNGDLFKLKPENNPFVKIDNNELLIHKTLLGFSDTFLLEGEWYRTGDQIEVVSESPLKFRFLSRKNEMINVGGYKVNPLEVEEVLNSHDSVLASKIHSKKNSVLGNILIADIKRKKDNLTEKEIRNFLQKKLQPFKIPRIINFVDQIELTRTGKIKR